MTAQEFAPKMDCPLCRFMYREDGGDPKAHHTDKEGCALRSPVTKRDGSKVERMTGPHPW